MTNTKRSSLSLLIATLTLAAFATVGCSGDSGPEPLDLNCAHEAGHVVLIQHATGYVVTDITATEGRGRTNFSMPVPSTLENLWRECAIAAAGLQADRQFLGVTRGTTGGDGEMYNARSDDILAAQENGEDVAPPWSPEAQRHWSNRDEIVASCYAFAGDELTFHGDEHAKVRAALNAKQALTQAELFTLIGRPHAEY